MPQPEFDSSTMLHSASLTAAARVSLAFLPGVHHLFLPTVQVGCAAPNGRDRPLLGKLRSTTRNPNAALRLRPLSALNHSPRPSTSSAGSKSELQPSEVSALSHDSESEVSALTATVLSLTSSAIGSLIGTGGGILLTPFLTAVGVSQRTAQATTQVVVTVTALVSSIRYLADGHVDTHLTVTLTSLSILTAPLGALLATRAPAKALRRTFGGVLLFAAAALMGTTALYAEKSGVSGETPDALLAVLSAGTAFFGGVAGVSGSTLNVPLLTVLADVGQKKAQGTALLAAVLPSAIASLQQARGNTISRALLKSLVPGAVVGGLVGSSAASLIADDSLRLVCAVVLGAIGARYIATAHLAR